MPTTAAISAAEHLKRVPPAVRPTVQAARRTVKAAAPKANEITYRSSRAPGATSPSMYKVFRYVVDEVQVVGIGTFPQYATMFFSRGRELDDPSGLLEGSGKARFVRLRTPADAERPALKRIVSRAFRLEGQRLTTGRATASAALTRKTSQPRAQALTGSRSL